MEFTTLLSVLLDLGIEPYTTKENILLDKEIGHNMYHFYGTVGSNGIDDTELNLFVFDNMNGLIAIKQNGEMVLNNYLNLSANNVVVTQTSYNEALENIFKDREFNKKKKKYKCEPISEEIVFYNSYPEIISEHCSFFRKVVAFAKEYEKKYSCFYNACKLYNNAHCIGANNPTAMISYFVASIEALSKSENSETYIREVNSDMDKCVKFCKKYYLDDDFDEKFIKYIYGKIRSGHFHSGESSFYEYDCNYDLSLNSDFFQMRDILLRARSVLRKVIINWIKINILEKY